MKTSLLPESVVDSSLRTLGPRAAYNLIANQYDAWHWQEFWRRNEVPLVLRYLERLRGLRTALDIGTGTGLYAGLLASRDVRVVGMDLSEKMLSVARKRLQDGVHLIQGDAIAVPVARESFDVVIAARVFSHVSDISRALAEAARVLRDGGHFIMTDVDPSHDYRATRIAIGKRVVYIDTYKWTAEQIISFAEDVGFTLKKMRRLTANNLQWLPDSPSFHSLDRTGSRAVGQILVFRRIHRKKRISS